MKEQPPVIVFDADGLIALFNENDAHAGKAIQLLEKLQAVNAKIIYPVTCITETVTTLQRRMQRPDLVKQIISLFHLHRSNLLIEPVDSDLLFEAVALFDPNGSKKNTLFDAVVAAVAARHTAQAIFSFDGWYSKQGFTLVADMTSLLF